MSIISGIVSYGGTTGINTNRCFAFNESVRGVDSFYGSSSPVYLAHWVGVLVSGEERIAPEGGKATALEVWLRTYVSGTSGTTRPYAYIQVRQSAESLWTSPGADTDATIAVTNTACTGTNAAWSNTIAAGDDATTVFSLPCLAAKARVYIDSTLQVLGTDYTVTGTKQITLAVALASATTLYAYWSGTPQIKVSVGDCIETAYGWHRITAIPTYNTLTLLNYPQPTIVSTAGTHHVAKLLPAGEGETVFGINRELDTIQLRIVVIPRYDANAADNVRLLSAKLGFVATGERQKKAP